MMWDARMPTTTAKKPGFNMLNSGLYATSTGGTQLMPNSLNDAVSTANLANTSQKVGRCKPRIVLANSILESGQGTCLGTLGKSPSEKLISSRRMA